LVFLALAGCASVLGLRDIDEGAEPIAAANDGDAAIVAPDAGVQKASDPDASASPDADEAGLVGIDCLGQRIDAFFCDGFEGAALSSSWVTEKAGESYTEFGQKEATDAVAGAHRGYAHTGNSGGPFTAKATWMRPGGPGALAFQLNVRFPPDSWTANDTITVAAFTTSEGKRVEVQFTADNVYYSSGALKVTFEGATLPLGTIENDLWQCIELVADGSAVFAYRGTNQVSSSLKNVGPVTTAELGIPSTPLATKDILYDDIVLAPARVGCLHDK
jgi:hypothetical protein